MSLDNKLAILPMFTGRVTFRSETHVTILDDRGVSNTIPRERLIGEVPDGNENCLLCDAGQLLRLLRELEHQSKPPVEQCVQPADE